MPLLPQERADCDTIVAAHPRPLSGPACAQHQLKHEASKRNHYSTRALQYGTLGSDPPPLDSLTQGPHMSGWNSRHTAARIHLLGFSPSAMRIGAWKVNVGPRMVVE